jgi:hypothetical protein
MARKYVAFDIETAKDVPGEDFNWKPHRPLGICCAAGLCSDAQEPILWYGKTGDGQPAPRMSKAEAAGVVRELAELVAKGYTLLTWNGLGFDLDILAEESGLREECRELVLGHVDMMFHVFCEKGFPVGLDKAAQGLGIPGKPPGMSGEKAPLMWAAGQHEDVLKYVTQDVRAALQIGHTCEGKRRFAWLTRKGTTSTMDLKKGWLNVREAMQLPLPDTSWMREPIPRREFTRWLEGR